MRLEVMLKVHVRTKVAAVGWLFLLCACTASPDRDRNAALEETISAQSTSVTYLSTQASKQEQPNLSQWEVISYLSTQMPIALELITPIAPGIPITRTPYAPSEQARMPALTPTPELSIDIEYPADTRTGIKEIDDVIDIIMNQDVEARLDLVQFIATACTTTSGLGGPPNCESEEANGTIVDAFPVSNGEGHFVRPGNIPDTFDFTVRGLFAVYTVPEDAYRTDYWPAGEYGIVFTSEDGGYPHAITVLVEDAQIVRLEFIPDWPPFDLVREKSDEFILPAMR